MIDNGKFFVPSSLSNIRQSIAGNVGNRGVVVGYRKDGTSHAFNVINKNGKVHFFDGQNNSRISNLDEYEGLYFLPTNY
ncbi:toxin glutamine deamidase domain-containing protein [Aeoliella straminimaris]|uniref:toxin glutamine deamidase domain-containing protein n=1 Tax=Aeoliella straminimaris TaxID=2954799 RepID=UPI003CC58EDC